MRDIADISILAVGQGWIAVEKPAAISVHNDPGNDLTSILAVRIRGMPPPYPELRFDPDYGLHAVHRLDRDTSGVMLMAAAPETFHHLARQFQDRTVRKRYLAVLHGPVTAAGDSGEALWEWPLTKAAGGRRDPQGKGARKSCRTQLRILRSTPHYALIECEPLTGRQHQIRRHAKLAGHPVVGDGRYGSPRSLRFLQTRCGFHRLGLHADALTVVLPGEPEPTTLRSAGMPPEMARLLDQDG